MKCIRDEMDLYLNNFDHASTITRLSIQTEQSNSKVWPWPEVDPGGLVEELDAVGDGLVVVRVQRVQVRAAPRRPLWRVAAAATASSCCCGGASSGRSSRPVLVDGEGDLGRPRREGEEPHQHPPEAVHQPGRPPPRRLVVAVGGFPPKAFRLQPRQSWCYLLLVATCRL